MKAHAALPIAMAIAVAAIALPLPAPAANVGVTITLGEPGFYGRIDLGRMAPPPIIREYPVLIRRAPRGILLEPLYVRVPDREQKDWRRYCGRYDACGRPVYFVRDDWYQNEYVPRYRDRNRQESRDDRREERREDRRDDRDDRKEDRRDDNDRGRGRSGN